MDDDLSKRISAFAKEIRNINSSVANLREMAGMPEMKQDGSWRPLLNYITKGRSRRGGKNKHPMRPFGLRRDEYDTYL